LSEPNSSAIKVLFASGSEDANERVAEILAGIFPELPLVVVAEFKLPLGEWIPFHILRSAEENRAFVESRLRGRQVRLGAVILEPHTPHGPLRRLGYALSGINVMIFNETGSHFMLRPRSIPAIIGFAAWRLRNLIRKQFEGGGLFYEGYRLLRNPKALRLSILFRLAMRRGRRLERSRAATGAVAETPAPKPVPGTGGAEKIRAAPPEAGAAEGISVVIPSRNGAELLRTCLPRIEGAGEIIVVDNGSEDGTAEMLRREFPNVIVEQSAQPLSFARAVNRGIARSRYSHVCLLNNDMWVEPGFLSELRKPFSEVPDLFCSTAQIFFPEGQRREETGKTILLDSPGVTEFPVSCQEPLAGEDRSYVLYGSGGCSLYDREKLAALGGIDEVYDPAYCEDLDIGARAWSRGWPSVYVAGARVLHFHRTTTSKYFSPEQLDLALDVNFARFLSRVVQRDFLKLWNAAVVRLKVQVKFAALEKMASMPSVPVSGDASFYALCNGDVAVFPGQARRGKPVVLVVSPYVPFPLSHGAAVRIYNLMRRAARDFDQVLVAFSEEAGIVPRELLDICVEVVRVRRRGTHALPSTPRPETVEEFDSPAFHAATRQTAAKWKPRIAQLEFTQMVSYAADCGGARTVLVEHDITYDLFAQMLAREEDWETRRQYERWVRFEREAWKRVDRVVTMSEKDRSVVEGRAVAIANGVDLERFRPGIGEPEPRRLLFVGSFAHKPNVLAVEFFLREVFPKLAGAMLHVIAGMRHERFWDLKQAGVEVEGFVSDVRPAYERAAIVIAPLVASAGTNIKIMEAMAMGKAVVSTEAGIHGLELERGRDVIVTDSAEEMAREIARLFDSPEDRKALERRARETAERLYGWDAIAERQRAMYEELLRF
jgi:GT2 family glycosyltransferase/glycosyltransferase involved in cell wall biosynthesis